MTRQRLAAGAPELREFAAFFSDSYFETAYSGQRDRSDRRNVIAEIGAS
jgi:hypothetical protein